MDQMIRRILELDADTEEQLRASELECRRTVEDAQKKAAALAEAQAHQTRDTIEEYEEQKRADYEAKSAELRAGFDKRADVMETQFNAQHDALLDALFTETLREAES